VIASSSQPLKVGIWTRRQGIKARTSGTADLERRGKQGPATLARARISKNNVGLLLAVPKAGQENQTGARRPCAGGLFVGGTGYRRCRSSAGEPHGSDEEESDS
jgi:hypothetical protein